MQYLDLQTKSNVFRTLTACCRFTMLVAFMFIYFTTNIIRIFLFIRNLWFSGKISTRAYYRMNSNSVVSLYFHLCLANAEIWLRIPLCKQEQTGSYSYHPANSQVHSHTCWLKYHFPTCTEPVTCSQFFSLDIWLLTISFVSLRCRSLCSAMLLQQSTVNTLLPHPRCN